MLYLEIVLISVLVFFFGSMVSNLYGPKKQIHKRDNLFKYKDAMNELEGAFSSIKKYGYSSTDLVCPHFISTQAILMLIAVREIEIDSSYLNLESKTVRLIYNLNNLLDFFINKKVNEDEYSKLKFRDITKNNPLIDESANEVQECLDYINMKLKELQ